MVVDDDPTIRRALRRLLAALPPVIVEDFGDPREALARFAASPFDAVIADLEMPHMNGIELTQRLRELVPDVPVILATGVSSAEIHARAGAVQFYAVIEKPWEAGAMRQLIRDMLAARP